MLVVLAGAGALRAHHSHGNYTDTFTDVEGTVKAVHIINPHSWIYLDVKNAEGQIQTWALEATSVAGLQRSGVTRETLKAGIRSRCAAIRFATAREAASSGSSRPRTGRSRTGTAPTCRFRPISSVLGPSF